MHCSGPNTPLHKNVSYLISEFTYWNENSYMNCQMILNNKNKNNSILLEVLASLFTVSSYFTDNPRMSRHRCVDGLKKKLYLRSGYQRHRHFAGFFNVPALHRHGTNLFIRWFRHTAPLVAFYDTLGIRGTYSRLKPRASSRGDIMLCGLLHTIDNVYNNLLTIVLLKFVYFALYSHFGFPSIYNLNE